MEYQSFRAMNTEIVLAAEGNLPSIQAAFQAGHEYIVDSERRFTRFSEQSELAQLNRSAGGWFSASPPMFEVLQLALHYSASTGGLYDPSILEALKMAGYDRSIDLIRAMGSQAGIATGPVSVDANPTPVLEQVVLDPLGSRIWLPAGLGLDLGGIVKGWIAEQAVGRMARYVETCAVNAGGDLFLRGLPEGEPAWEIDLEDPRDSEQSLGVLRVGAGAIATSSVTKRRWRQGEKEQHHLIDPRTRAPAKTTWLSVTVFAPSAALAEVLAKAIMIAGPSQAQRLVTMYPQSAFLAVDHSGSLSGSNNFEECFYVA